MWCKLLKPKNEIDPSLGSAQLHAALVLKQKFLKDKSSGFSIVEVLVALGIMAVVTMGMMTLITNQTTEIKGIDEKMALQAVQTQVSNVLSSPAFCGCFLGTSRTFDYQSTRVWSSPLTSIASSYETTCAPAGTAFLTVGTALGPKLLPTAMNLQNITETTANSGNFTADLVLQFDQTLLTRSRKSLSVPMYFSLNMVDPIAARRLGTCSSVAAAAPIDLATLCAQMNGFYNGTTCEPTYQ